MEILKQEVKTIYDIEFTESDFLKAFEEWVIHPLKDCYYDDAFDTKDCSSLDVAKLFTKFSLDCKTLQFIAKEFFGFDGIENYGFYSEKKKTRLLVVYNYGDDINK